MVDKIVGGVSRVRLDGAGDAPADRDSRKIVSIKSNYFPVDFDKSLFPTHVFHYDVVISGDKPTAKVPDRLLLEIWRTFEEQYHGRLGARIPFDGKRNAFAAKELNFGVCSIFSTEITFGESEDVGNARTYVVHLKLVRKIATAAMFQFLCTGTSKEEPQPVLQALEIALRKSPSHQYIFCEGRFVTDKQPHLLSNILELWFGHCQSLVLGRNETTYLNMDMANKAFLKKIPVSLVMQKQLSKGEGKLAVNDWSSDDFRKANGFVSGKLLQYRTGDGRNQEVIKQRRFIAVGLVAHSSKSYKFTIRGEENSIEEYFLREKGIKLRHPDWPVVHVGDSKLTNFVPLELCEVVPQVFKGKMEARDTSEVIKGAAKPPSERFQRIQDSRDACGFDKCPVLKEFGMKISSSMVQIDDAKRLPNPTITIKNRRGMEDSNQATGKDGKFQLEKFLNGAHVPRVGVVNVSGRSQDWFQNQVKLFMKRLGDEACNFGMIGEEGIPVSRLFENSEYTAVKVRMIRGGAGSNSQFQLAIGEALRKLKEKGFKMIIVVIGNDGVEYPAVKCEADIRVGVLTQCVKEATILKASKPTGGSQVLTNILLKINAKLGGLNFKLGRSTMKMFQFEESPVLFIGADLSHPTPSSSAPSVAAITASCDVSGMIYQMKVLIQEQGSQVILGLKKIVVEILKDYKKKTGRAPKRIIVFRGGVSDGQFPAIKKEEYGAIVDACKSLSASYSPKLTFIIVKKRHATRFLPLRLEDSVKPKGNVAPGTVVDSKITTLSGTNFFLNSHVGIQGTSRPSHYHILHDDLELSMEQLQLLAYSMCYTYVRCTQPVSYPAPTYYASLAAYRARILLEKEGDNADLEALQSRMTIHPDIASNHPMFFV